MILKEENAQLSAEYLLLIAFVIVSVIGVSVILNENELNMIISSARVGVEEGIESDGLSVYPKETFDNYLLKNPQLTYPQDIKILKIVKTDMGFDNNYNKKRIQLRVYASSSSLKSSDKNSAGDRINYNARKTISSTFKNENSSNPLYNPCFSNNYVITTGDVQWI
ncbi:MAG: hypothetical protein LBT66_03565 [Methanobrevibacter sp.]|jgi:uncharacterized protein (UPF0333 family)|nr:hypothetical protein [Candidatus Methanovirga meridionalis]